jgi:hypothetical protein
MQFPERPLIVSTSSKPTTGLSSSQAMVGVPDTLDPAGRLSWALEPLGVPRTTSAARQQQGYNTTTSTAVGRGTSRTGTADDDTGPALPRPNPPPIISKPMRVRVIDRMPRFQTPLLTNTQRAVPPLHPAVAPQLPGDGPSLPLGSPMQSYDGQHIGFNSTVNSSTSTATASTLSSAAANDINLFRHLLAVPPPDSYPQHYNGGTLAESYHQLTAEDRPRVMSRHLLQTTGILTDYLIVQSNRVLGYKVKVSTDPAYASQSDVIYLSGSSDIEVQVIIIIMMIAPACVRVVRHATCNHRSNMEKQLCMYIHVPPLISTGVVYHHPWRWLGSARQEDRPCGLRNSL